LILREQKPFFGAAFLIAAKPVQSPPGRHGILLAVFIFVSQRVRSQFGVSAR
jgi:hypothetical protein